MHGLANVECLLLVPGAELPLVESFGLLNDLFPLPSILDADYPVFDLHLADVLFNVILNVECKSVYLFVSTCSTSYRLYDTLTDLWNVCM